MRALKECEFAYQSIDRDVESLTRRGNEMKARLETEKNMPKEERAKIEETLKKFERYLKQLAEVRARVDEDYRLLTSGKKVRDLEEEAFLKEGNYIED